MPRIRMAWVKKVRGTSGERRSIEDTFKIFLQRVFQATGANTDHLSGHISDHRVYPKTRQFLRDAYTYGSDVFVHLLQDPPHSNTDGTCVHIDFCYFDVMFHEKE